MEGQSTFFRIDEEFITVVLRKSGNSVLNLLKYSVRPAVPPGNNFGSEVYRVLLKYRDNASHTHELSLIVKIPHTTGFLGEYLEVMDLFGKERDIYDTILPVIDQKLEYQFAPKSFYCPLNKGLVLLDLKEEGYTMCSKEKRLDFTHCKKVFETVAKYHAASVACYHHDRKLVESVSKEVVYPDGGPFEEGTKIWLEATVECAANKLKEIKGCEAYAILLSDKVNTICESAKGMCKRKQTGLNVLNHGDLWTNNILFKYNEVMEVEAVKFIDYPVARLASPTLDLLFFLWMSADVSVLRDSQEELFTIYLYTLNSTLDQLACPERMATDELMEDLRSHSDWALLSICALLPNVLSDPKDNNIDEPSPEDVQNDKPNERIKKLLSGKKFSQILPMLMKLFVDWKTSIG